MATSLDIEMAELPFFYIQEKSIDESDLTVNDQKMNCCSLSEGFIESPIQSDNEESTQEKESNPQDELKQEIPSINLNQVLKSDPICNWLPKLKQLQQVFLSVSLYLKIEQVQELQYINSRFYYQTKKISLRWAIYNLNDKIFWETVSEFQKVSQIHAQEYLAAGINYDEESQHSRDLDRTYLFDDAEIIENNKLKLDRVLRALTVKGLYFQGLNYIASAFLINSEELNTYWYIRFILYRLQNFQNNMQRLSNLIKRLQVIVKSKFPTLHNHLDQQNLTIQYFSARWLIVLFSYDISIDLMLKLWKLVVLTDENMLICFTLSLLKRLQGTILQLEQQDINKLLKNGLKEATSQFNNQEVLLDTIQVYVQQFGDLSLGFNSMQLQENAHKNSLYFY